MGKKLNKFAKQMIDAGMPMKAVSELTDLYLDQNFTGVVEIKIKEDPYVEGTFAIRIVQMQEVYYRHENEEKKIEYLSDLDLLWNKGDYGEVEFNTWPPTAGPNNLQFL